MSFKTLKRCFGPHTAPHNVLIVSESRGLIDPDMIKYWVWMEDDVVLYLINVKPVLMYSRSLFNAYRTLHIHDTIQIDILEWCPEQKMWNRSKLSSFDHVSFSFSSDFILKWFKHSWKSFLQKCLWKHPHNLSAQKRHHWITRTSSSVAFLWRSFIY